MFILSYNELKSAFTCMQLDFPMVHLRGNLESNGDKAWPFLKVLGTGNVAVRCFIRTVFITASFYRISNLYKVFSVYFSYDKLYVSLTLFIAKVLFQCCPSFFSYKFLVKKKKEQVEYAICIND
jgi:hypothetical protein